MRPRPRRGVINALNGTAFNHLGNHDVRVRRFGRCVCGATRCRRRSISSRRQDDCVRPAWMRRTLGYSRTTRCCRETRRGPVLMCSQTTAALRGGAFLWSAERGDLRLRYSLDREPVHLAISMTFTKLWGVRRWWFVCPVTGTRVGKLYLPHDADTLCGTQGPRSDLHSCQESGRE